MSLRFITRPLAWLVGAGLAACSPALDWRDVQLDAAALRLQMPCKPARQQRTLPLAGTPVLLTLLVCSADGQTFGLAHADVVDPARVLPALQELGAAAARNIGGTASRTLPLQLPGATPSAGSQRQRLAGRLPDGKPAQMELALFVVGTRVFQASVLGETVRDDAVETFFGALQPGR